MKDLNKFVVLYLFSISVFCLVYDSALAKGDGDGILQSQRPGFFKELENTKIVCMKSCPKKVASIFGIQVICGNYEQELFELNCQRPTGHNQIEYCNCDNEQCAKFHVECTEDGSTCEIRMTEIGISPIACKCNNSTCKSPGDGLAYTTCFMRKELATNECDIHRIAKFNDGRTFHTACDDDRKTCVSEGMKIRDSFSPHQLPTDHKPGESK